MEKQSETKNKSKTIDKVSAIVSKTAEAAAYAALGAAIVSGTEAPKITSQKESIEISTPNIDRQMVEREADMVVFMLDRVFQEGGVHAQRDAENLVLQYLETGTVREIKPAVHQESDPSLERRQAVERLGEAVMALSRVNTKDRPINAKVGDMLSRVSRQFSQGMSELAKRNLGVQGGLKSDEISSGDFGSTDYYEEEEVDGIKT